MKLPTAVLDDVDAGVAPRAGAWIETAAGVYPPPPSVSPPARGRGLKLSILHAFGIMK